MKVLIFYNTAWYIYNFRRNLIQELQKQGCSVVAVAPRDLYAEKLEQLGVEFEDIQISPRSVNPFSEIGVVFNFLKILRKTKPDYVLSFTIKCNLYAGLCRYFCNSSKQVANVSGLGEAFEKKGLVNKVARFLYRISMKNVGCVFFQNPEDREFCVSSNLVPLSSARLLPGSGVDLDLYTSAIKSDLNETSERSFLIFGRLLPKKGYDEFIAAARELKAIYGERVSFKILGMVDENRQESIELQQRIIQAEKYGVVQYLPPTDNVVPVLSEVDVVVLPSEYNEGIPRSLLEGLAAGKAIVTTDWKGCRETVIEGINGFLVPVRDPGALARAMERLINLRVEDFRSFGKQSRKLAAEKFDEKLVISRYLQVVGLQPLEIPHARDLNQTTKLQTANL